MQGAARSRFPVCRRPAQDRRPSRPRGAAGLTDRSEQEVVEPSQPDRLAAGERLGVPDAEAMPPVSGPVTDRLDNSRLAFGLVVHQLRAIAAQRSDLALQLVRNVDDQAGPLNDPQVDAEIV